MTFQIQLEPIERSFSCEAGETLLHAATRQGIALKQGCAVGACRACKARVIRGHVHYPPQFRNALTEEEVATGYALLCCARPASGLRIHIDEGSIGAHAVQEFAGVVETIERTGDIAVCRLRLPRHFKLEARPGQYLQVMWRDGRGRAFSIANRPRDEGVIELHIRCREGGAFSEYVVKHMRTDDVLRMRGPFGDFSLKAGSDKPVLCVATGTGFAPMQALIDQLVAEVSRRSVLLYWGGRSGGDLYFRSRIEQWQRSAIRFSFTPVLSRPEHGCWSGRTGYVGAALQQDIADFSGYEAYVCGAPAMVEDVFRRLTVEGGLPESAFYADAFYCGSAPMPATGQVLT